MVETVDTEWSQLAIDDGTVSLEYEEYDVVIGGDAVEKIAATPTKIRYSPSVNKAKNLTVDIPPDPSLEGLSYLGESIQLFVSGELAFEGEIRKIDTQDKDGEDYSIVARPPGKRLKGSDLEENASNEVFSDRISSIADKFNEYDAEHEELVDTANENENNVKSIGGNVKAVSTGTSGTVNYPSVGSDLSQVTSIYIKAYTPNQEIINFEVSSSSESYTSQLSDLNKNVYGEWVRLTDFPNVNEQYDISFTLDENTLLIDWISVINEKVNRKTSAPEVTPIDENIDFYSRSGQELEDNSEESGSGIQFNSSGEPQTRQITAWATDPFPRFLGDDTFVNGDAGQIETGEPEVEWTFSSSDVIEDWAIYGRVKPYEIFVNRNEQHTLGNSPYDSAWSGSASVSTDQVAVQDSSVYITGDSDKDFQWRYNRNDVTEDLTFSSQAYFPSVGNFRWSIQDSSDNGYELRVNSSSIELVRLDTGSGNTLDTASASPQSGEWANWDITIEGGGVSASYSDSQNSVSVSSGDTTHGNFEEFHVNSNDQHYLDDMFADTEGETNVSLNLDIAGNELNDIGLILSQIPYREWGWTSLAEYNFTSSFPDSISFADVRIQASNSNETAFAVSPLVLVHKESKWNEDSDFDETVHEPEGHLDYPPTYAQGDIFDTNVVFSEEVSNTNISESTVDSTVNTEVDILSSWGPSQVIEGQYTDFPTPENSSTVTDSYSYSGVEHIVQYTLSSAGQRDTDSPRTGFNRQTLSSYDVDFSTNDLEVLFDRDLSDNRLALMNSLAEDSSVLFRWNGNTAEIFHRGQESTNVDLHSENITSSVSIEDVYESCEVIGLHNVRSGVITSDEAPDFVDDHKTIRTEDIESETDALNRARRFLNNHGSIKYKGKIKTLPTFAPLGAEVDGSLFNHGQDMIIRGVSYSKRGTTINLGYEKDIATELISLENETQGTKSRTSSKGMTIPVGPEQI